MKKRVSERREEKGGEKDKKREKKKNRESFQIEEREKMYIEKINEG